MSSKNITFALVPGSFATPQMYDKCEALLHAQGYRTLAIELLTANDGSRLPPATCDNDVDHIRSKLLSMLDGTDSPDVILAVHSYAGIPGTAAIQGLNKASRAKQGKANGVVGILYIAAAIPEVGESLRSIMIDNFPDLLPEPFRTGWPGEYMPAIPLEMAPVVFSDLKDPEEISKYGAMMVRHANDAYDGKCTFAGWQYDDVECVLILPELDQTLPVMVQEWMVKRRNGKIRVVRVEGIGHIVNVSRPEVIVGELIKMAQHP